MTRKVGSGITPTGGEANYKSSGRPFVRSQNVGWSDLILDDVAYIDEETHRSFDSSEIAALDVLLNITGASIGRSAIADSRIVGGNVNQHVCIIRVKPDELNPVLLNQYLISEHGQKQIDSFQAGGNRQGLNFGQIRSFKITLPPTEGEQIRIADCLTSLDELIGAQGRKVEALKAHKKGLMQQLFPREGETLPRLRFPEFRDAPEWATHAFEDFVAKSFYGTSQPTSAKGRYPVLRMGNMVDGGLDFFNLVYLDLDREEFESIRLHYGDILLNRTNSLDLVGKIAIFTRELECITASYIVTFRLDKDRLLPAFCNAMLNTQLYKARIKMLARPSVSQANINPTMFRKELRVSVPTVAEQQRIADCLSALDARIAAEADKLGALKTHKKGLMQQLFPSPEGIQR